MNRTFTPGLICLLTFQLLWNALPAHVPVSPKGDLPVVPLPQEVEYWSGYFPLVKGKTLTCYWPEEMDTLALNQLRAELAAQGITLERTQLKKATLLFGLVSELASFNSRTSDEPSRLARPVGTEGYHLIITPRNIVAGGQTETGVFYAVQTLRQLLRAYHRDGTLPALHIIDFPDFPFRGVMDDISRNGIPHPEFMKEQIRRLSELKINYLNYYIEDAVRTRQHPAFAPEEALTPEQWRELAEYADRYHVRLIGGFQSLAHAEAVLAHPEYAALGASARMYRPAGPETLDFLRSVYSELVPAFNCRFFHINSQEPLDLLQVGAEAPPEQLYLDHVRPLLDFLIDQGCRPMIWGDFLLQYPQLLDSLPPQTVVLPWSRRPGGDYEGMLRPIRQKHLDVVVSPAIMNENRLLPEFPAATANIREFAAAARKEGAMGLLTAVWDGESGHNFFTYDWYGVAFAAEQSWQVNDEPVTAFDERFTQGWLGDVSGLLPEVIHTLNRLAYLEPTWGMADEVLYRQLVPVPGRELGLDTLGWAEAGEIIQRAARLLRTAELQAKDSPHLERDLPYWRYIVDLYGAMADSRRRLLKMSKAYFAAEQYVAVQPDSARLLLNQAIGECILLTDRWDRLAETFDALMVQESYSCGAGTVTALYAGRMQGLRRLLVELSMLGKAVESQPLVNWRPYQEFGLDIRPLAHRYFTSWLVADPLPPGTLAPPTDILAARGGLLIAPPRTGDVLFSPEGLYLRWDQHRSPLGDRLDLTDAADTTGSVVYAYCRLDSPGERRLRALLGSNEKITVYCNGIKVYEKDRKQHLVPEEDECWLPLQAGKNDLVVEIHRNAQGGAFSFRLPEVTIRQELHHYSIVE